MGEREWEAMTPRERDALVARAVFGAECIHELERVPAHVLAEQYAADFREEYGQDPPEKWALNEADIAQESDYPTMWCGRCRVRQGQGIKGPTTRSLPRYTTDIAAAWEVVEKLRQAGWLVRVQEMPDGHPWLGPDDMDPQPKVYRRAHCALSWMPMDAPREVWMRIHLHPFALADTAPEAICRAALQACEMLAEEERRYGPIQRTPSDSTTVPE